MSAATMTNAELLAALPKTPGDVLPGTWHELNAIRDEITRRGLWPQVR